jgi:tetrapyrrole methylase family protein/MazG family protein
MPEANGAGSGDAESASRDPESAAFSRLFSIIQRLRAPDGCPWDRQQSPRTLRAALIEEAWECISAIDNGDDPNMEEELGDLYLLVTMMAWMKEEQGAFTVESALSRISEKLVRRHPHVFGDAESAIGDADSTAVSSPEQVLIQWDAIKAQEKADQAAIHHGHSRGASGAHPSSLDGVPSSFPPLERAAKLQKKAAKVGFDWPGPEPVWAKIDEELAELRRAVESGTPAGIEGEMGDLLFSVVNLARLLHVDPAIALHQTNVKFDRRFREVERRLSAQGTTPREAGLPRMDALWNQVKAEEPGGAESASGGAESASGGAQSASK